MKIKQIINLPVYTQSQQFLGHVLDLEFDKKTGQLKQLLVGDQKILDKILHQEKFLLIHWTQVNKVLPDKIIVEDAAIKLKDELASAEVVPAIET